jgi:hypothetical protein
MTYVVPGCDIVVRKRWMRDINPPYKSDHDSNEMRIVGNLWKEQEDSRVHYMPGLRQLDVDVRIVEQAKFMGIHIIQKAEHKNLSAHLLKWAVLIKIHHRSDARIHQTDKPPGQFQEMLTEFQSLLGEPTFAKFLDMKAGRF